MFFTSVLSVSALLFSLSSSSNLSRLCHSHYSNHVQRGTLEALGPKIKDHEAFPRSSSTNPCLFFQTTILRPLIRSFTDSVPRVLLGCNQTIFENCQFKIDFSPLVESSSEDSDNGNGFDIDLGAFELVDSGLSAETLLSTEDPVIFHAVSIPNSCDPSGTVVSSIPIAFSVL